jgi:hypothetical protein
MRRSSAILAPLLRASGAALASSEHEGAHLAPSLCWLWLRRALLTCGWTAVAGVAAEIGSALQAEAGRAPFAQHATCGRSCSCADCSCADCSCSTSGGPQHNLQVTEGPFSCQTLLPTWPCACLPIGRRRSSKCASSPRPSPSCPSAHTRAPLQAQQLRHFAKKAAPKTSTPRIREPDPYAPQPAPKVDVSTRIPSSLKAVPPEQKELLQVSPCSRSCRCPCRICCRSAAARCTRGLLPGAAAG